MSKKLIAFDVDGVLANFTRGFTRIGHRLFGTPVGDEGSQTTWVYENHEELGLSTPMIAAMWEEVDHDPLFWTMLDPLNVSVMSRINRIANKVFVTNRRGIDCAGQTISFLERWGIRHPYVIVASNKGEVARREQFGAMIDDLYTNLIDVDLVNHSCYTALLHRPYNVIHHDEWQERYCGSVVLSVDHFLDECKAQDLVETVNRVALSVG